MHSLADPLARRGNRRALVHGVPPHLAPESYLVEPPTSERDAPGPLSAVVHRAAAALTEAGSPGWRPLAWTGWELAGVSLAFYALLRLDGRVDLIWTPVPLWLPLVSLAAIVLLVRRLPPLVGVLWLWGLATYLWSLAPGNTLLTSLWALPYLALAAAGRRRHLFWLVAAYTMLQNLVSALSLNLFDLQSHMYTSGSVHYRLGAKALIVLVPAFVGFVQARSRWSAGVLCALASIATFAALMSGSRGVYVPLVIVVLVAAVRLTRQGRGRRVLVGLAVMAVVIVAADRALPFHPVAQALGSKATLQSQEASFGNAGGFTQRLRFWDQGLGMVRAHPFGVGFGGFRSTSYAFQRYPMAWSSSPHDVFVQMAATLGWPGVILLLGLLIVAFVRAWTSDRWPWALALLGIWFTLSVGVTANFPAMMALAFGVIGACLPPVAPARGDELPATPPRWTARKAAIPVATLAIAAGVALTGWWFVPCSGPQCALTRMRGVEYGSVAALRTLPTEDRPAFFQRLERLNPASLWVLGLEERYATTQAQRLAAARRIAMRYPLQSWRNYLQWAQLSLEAGDRTQARTAVERGLAVFGPGMPRYPAMGGDPSGFQQWLTVAHQILSETDPTAPPPNKPMVANEP